MNQTQTPRYTLISDATQASDGCRWRFVLRRADGTRELIAGDSEPGVEGERLELLAVIRGLEALDQPSEVTLVTRSRYVSRGLTYGLDEWRRNGWQWECFGEMAPIKNSDLWRRFDRALQFHRVECRSERIDRPQGAVPAPHFQLPRAVSSPSAQPEIRTPRAPFWLRGLAAMVAVAWESLLRIKRRSVGARWSGAH